MATNPNVANLAKEKIKIQTENIPENHRTVVVLELIEEHPDWKSAIESWETKEDRAMPAIRIQLETASTGDEVELDWETKWPLSNAESGYKEVYGVLRAEWYFGKELNMKKLAAKGAGNQGIDSLFFDASNNHYHIVESKCSAKFEKFSKFCTLTTSSANPHTAQRRYSAMGMLGKIKRHIPIELARAHREDEEISIAQFLDEMDEYKNNDETECITIKITQMHDGWVSEKIREMQKECKPENVRNNGAALDTALFEKRISRWFNFYATNPFYRLPGKYQVKGGRSAEFVLPQDKTKKAQKTFDWPDKKGDKIEFILLDGYELFLNAMDRQDTKNLNKLTK